MDDLLENVLLLAEVEQLTANPDVAARGTVIEAHMDRQTGAVASLLVSAGTLRAGDIVCAGAAYGKVSKACAPSYMCIAVYWQPAFVRIWASSAPVMHGRVA